MKFREKEIFEKKGAKIGIFFCFCKVYLVVRFCKKSGFTVFYEKNCIFIIFSQVQIRFTRFLPRRICYSDLRIVS